MSLNRYAKRRDENEAQIVKALESIGACVCRLDQPLDLLVGYRGKCFLIEVKGEGGRLTRGQREFLASWKGQAAVVREPQEAVRIVTGASVEMQGVRDSKS